MKTILLLAVWVGCLFGYINAQSLQPEVFSSAGYSDAGFQSWTIGEPMVETYAPGGANILTQGFHQPKITVVGVPESVIPLAVRVYPIPTLTDVYLEFPEEARSACEMELTAMNGQVLARRQFEQAPERTHFDLTKYSAGVYLIKVVWKNHNHHQVFRVEKIHY